MLLLRGTVFMRRTNSVGNFTVSNTYVNLSTVVLIRPPDNVHLRGSLVYEEK